MAGTKGSRDDTGLLSITVPFYVPDEAEVLTVGIEPPFGLVEVGREWSDVEGMSGFEVTVNYEGLEDGKDEGDESIEFDPSFAEEPIESHPAFITLKNKYGGTLDDKGRVQWTETYKPSNSALQANTGTSEKKNPLFGISTYLSLKSVFRRTYTLRDLPNDILDDLGGIEESLPDGFPTPSGRNWLRLPPKLSKRGNSYQVSEELILSPPGGKWPEGVHGLIES
jgi:hypothetical protein